jgi:hypothetical protein
VDALLERLAEEREALDARARRPGDVASSAHAEGDADHSD